MEERRAMRVDHKEEVQHFHSLRDRAVSQLRSLSIAKKLLLGYLTLVVLFVIVSAFSVYTLNRLNKMNRSILDSDIPMVELSEGMIEAVIAQEYYARRYAILGGPELLGIMEEKGKEVDEHVEEMRALPDADQDSVERIAALRSEYNALFAQWKKHLKDPSAPEGEKFESVFRDKQEEVIGAVRDAASKARTRQNRRIIATSEVGASAFRIILFFCAASIGLSLLLTVLITRNIAGPISRMKAATRKISEGSFEHIDGLDSQDELGDLAHSFNDMADRLKRLEEMYLDASPLTRLPGNIAIENVVQKRIESGVHFAFCYIDMDNFKAYNDKYGYAMGSKVILATAKVVEKCVAEVGTPEDFVGHIGGDDFVLVTTPDDFRKTCKRITEEFDVKIREFYDSTDLERGYIQAKSRQGVETKFPIMTISIAVVTNLERKLTNSIEVGEIAAELKEYAKSIPGSVYVVDRRRRDEREDSAAQSDKVLQFKKKQSDGREA